MTEFCLHVIWDTLVLFSGIVLKVEGSYTPRMPVGVRGVVMSA